MDKFLVYRFTDPQWNGVSTFVRVLDFKEAISMSRSDDTDSNWITNNWKTWMQRFTTFCYLQQAPAYRNFKSQKALHQRKSVLHEAPVIGQNCMEGFAMGIFMVFWWLLRVRKTMKSTSDSEAAEQIGAEIFLEVCALACCPEVRIGSSR